MPYCGKCGYEYVAGAKVCPDCQAALVEGEQAFCDNCGEVLSEEVVYCPHCGVFLGRSTGRETAPACDTHTGRKAVARCVVCKKPLCEECSVRKRSKYFCTNDKHVEMAFDWVAVHTTGTVYEADMIVANLESAGIPARAYVQNDQMLVATVGDLAVTRIMVPTEAADEAKDYLASLLGQNVDNTSQE